MPTAAVIRKQPSGRAGLKLLQVVDRLEVDRPRLTPTRLTATYRVIMGKRSETIDLVYRYPESVFQPGEPASENLAALIAAQVALNYGLFCREIRFAGPLDAADRKFLEEMAENTAREIYVKKFLEPNPFLRGPAAGMSAVRRDRYLHARLRFSDPPPGKEPAHGGWSEHTSRHAVLSSGGKDSLLSFGLLREMGCEVHPVFLNESGRHWFTAINAHRHLARTCPETARVWTNSDRVFAWMLRHLPFVRQDFSEVRSDEYPIRLWTVAVFLFGALPLIRRRGIGRIVIGDEFDTSQRGTRAGIPHFNGLYDQSRYFDLALTRYFHRKGWNLIQYSLLRPLSEMLIQKTLLERYPELQKHQVSCHAAHLEGKRVLPCGRCEKCRRIATMIIALGGNPGLCGYRKQQVKSCVKEFVARGTHQERPAVEHLAWMLERAGLLSATGTGKLRPLEHPEILLLRLDRERARLEEIPFDLRRSLIGILLKHADGAVRKRGRVWIPFKPLRDPVLHHPNPFEAKSRRAGASAKTRKPSGPRSGADFLLAELTWPRARERFRQTDLALLPVGSIEQHGPHLPLDTDAWDADYLARRVAESCRLPRPLVLPLIPYGVSFHHEDFSGTLSVSPEALSRMVYDIGISAARHGITKLIIINGHGGNVPTLKYAAQLINRDAHIFTCVDTGETSDADVARITETPNDVHAGEVETSTALATRPELVARDKARKFIPKFSSQYLDFSSSHSVEWFARTQRISPTGVLGDPTRASRAKGEKIWKIMIEHLVKLVESLKGLSLDEIYERRY